MHLVTYIYSRKYMKKTLNVKEMIELEQLKHWIE